MNEMSARLARRITLCCLEKMLVVLGPTLEHINNKHLISSNTSIWWTFDISASATAVHQIGLDFPVVTVDVSGVDFDGITVVDRLLPTAFTLSPEKGS